MDKRCCCATIRDWHVSNLTSSGSKKQSNHQWEEVSNYLAGSLYEKQQLTSHFGEILPLNFGKHMTIAEQSDPFARKINFTFTPSNSLNSCTNLQESESHLIRTGIGRWRMSVLQSLARSSQDPNCEVTIVWLAPYQTLQLYKKNRYMP